MALKGAGAKPDTASRDSSAVSRDTARLGGRIDSTARVTHPRPPAPPAVAPPGALPATRLNLTRAHDALDDLFFEKLDSATATMVRDSAMKFYEASGITSKDKAYAAFVVGQSYFQLKKRAMGCQFIREANEIDPSDASYSKLLEQCN
jgi:hypothetical protein